jgi:molybdenum cofactor synthesis domain-containing protein
MMEYTACVITVSDKGSRGEREDKSGPAICEMLEADGWRIVETVIVPDEIDEIRKAMIRFADETKACLIVTTGGTGFSKRDVTPEATLSVIERAAPGIPEAMRAKSMSVTVRGCLSREAAGLRGDSLIINCPGSVKAVRECLGAVLPALKHGVEILRGEAGECGSHA